ncbi:MAG: hypothetical protein DMD91_08095 [Candidatus Rokuibacteriota bacterium]|nr:MAG: hypothetical protein DMD91_08095 [Candidatus Rokubacteria bacterium]
MTTLRLDALGPAAARLLRLVVAAGATDAVLVGGVVRDARLGRVRRDRLDLDVAVPGGALALARRIAERGRGTLVPLDDERGTARVVLGAARIDVADFRASTIEGDLAARDFTVNALAVPVRTLLSAGRATIVDPTGGLADLRARRLRLPGRGVLDDDPLRGLRGIRLEATLGLRLTPSTTRAIRAVAPRLAGVAVERVRDRPRPAPGRRARAARRRPARGRADAGDVATGAASLPRARALAAGRGRRRSGRGAAERSLAVRRRAGSPSRRAARWRHDARPRVEARRALSRRGQARDAAGDRRSREILRA